MNKEWLYEHNFNNKKIEITKEMIGDIPTEILKKWLIEGRL